MLYLQHLLRAILSFSIRPALSVVRWVLLSTGSFKNRTCITGISIRSILNDKRARAKGAIKLQTCVAVVGLSNGSESWMGLSSCLSRRCIYIYIYMFLICTLVLQKIEPKWQTTTLQCTRDDIHTRAQRTLGHKPALLCSAFETALLE